MSLYLGTIGRKIVGYVVSHDKLNRAVVAGFAVSGTELLFTNQVTDPFFFGPLGAVFNLADIFLLFGLSNWLCIEGMRLSFRIKEAKKGCQTRPNC